MSKARTARSNESGTTCSGGRDREARSAGIGKRLRQVRAVADLNAAERKARGIGTEGPLRHARSRKWNARVGSRA